MDMINILNVVSVILMLLGTIVPVVDVILGGADQGILLWFILTIIGSILFSVCSFLLVN